MDTQPETLDIKRFHQTIYNKEGHKIKHSAAKKDDEHEQQNIKKKNK